MELTYELTGDDVWPLHKYVMLHSPQFKRVRPLLLLPVFGAVMGASAGGFSPLSLLVGVVMLGALIWLTPRLMKKQVIAQSAKQPGLLGVHTIRIDEAGVHSKTPLHEGNVGWNGITEVVSYRDHLFLFTGPQVAYIIPKRAFAGPDDADQFLQTANGYRRG